MTLPAFRFHPDPVRSGSVEASTTACRCCQATRGWIYTGPVYAKDKLDDALCPWCIADGSAHAKFGAEFVDTNGCDDDVAPELVIEIAQRTPGFASFQAERWLSCCGEPAAFVMPAGITEIRAHFRSLEGELMSFIVHQLGISGGAARRVIEALHRDRSPAAFVFQCRKCERHLGYVDYA